MKRSAAQRRKEAMARGWDLGKLFRPKRAPDPELWAKRIRRLFPSHDWQNVSANELRCSFCRQTVWRDGYPTTCPPLPAGRIYFQLEHDGQCMGWVKNALLRCEEAQVQLVHDQ